MTDFFKKNAGQFFLPVLILLSFWVVLPASVSAQSKQEVCTALGQGYNAGSNTCTAPAGSRSVQNIIEAALNILSIVVGIAAVIMIILAGFRYITAGGDASKVSGAQNTILWAVVGLVVAAFAQIIVRFVLGQL